MHPAAGVGRRIDVRIGLELSGLQSASRYRGIGRYVLSLVTTLLGRDPTQQYVLYAQDGMPLDLIPDAPNASLQLVRPDRNRGESTLLDALGRVARSNPDRLDVLAILNPLEMCASRELPAKPLNGLAMVAVVYDLIPFLFRDRCMPDPSYAARFYRRLRPLRRYDALLAISESTRTDCLAVLNLPTARVIDISSASDGTFFIPDRSDPMPEASHEALHSLGIDRPFVLAVGVGDDRKNATGLADAFARLPRAVRASHQLVLAGGLGESARRDLHDHLHRLGIAREAVLAGRVSDEALRVLYQRCAAFVFPSWYEGFGLPILEAMHCGAAVIAGANSSLIEAVGDAGLLADADDPDAIAEQLRRVLTDHTLANSLRELAPAHAASFTWERTADRTLEALQRTGGPRPARPKVAATRSRVALLAPPGERHRGDAERLVAELARSGAVDVFHEAGKVPHRTLGSPEHGAHDHRIFPRLAAILHYRAILDPWGQADRHPFLAEALDGFAGPVLGPGKGDARPGEVDLGAYAARVDQLTRERWIHAEPPGSPWKGPHARDSSATERAIPHHPGPEVSSR